MNDSGNLARIEAETRELVERLAAEEAAAEPIALPPLPARQSDDVLARAERLYRARRRRAIEFAELADLFHEPAWDMVLALFISEGRARQVSLTELCVGAAVPGTTGLRYIAALRERGVVRVVDDPEDHQRHYVSLDPAMSERLAAFLAGPEFSSGGA